MDAVERGETFGITRRGTVVAELRPAVSGGFVGSTELKLAFAHLAAGGLDALRADTDAVFGEDRIGG
jgi:antitoxin (DNA-binding transcriptional repressor) of toxin-antitoxin stability system